MNRFYFKIPFSMFRIAGAIQLQRNVVFEHFEIV